MELVHALHSFASLSDARCGRGASNVSEAPPFRSSMFYPNTTIEQKMKVQSDEPSPSPLQCQSVATFNRKQSSKCKALCGIEVMRQPLTQGSLIIAYPHAGRSNDRNIHSLTPGSSFTIPLPKTFGGLAHFSSVIRIERIFIVELVGIKTNGSALQGCDIFRRY